jgi:hypothetical protein
VDFYLEYNEKKEFDIELFEIASIFTENPATYIKIIDSFNRRNFENIWRKPEFSFNFLQDGLNVLGKEIPAIDEFILAHLVDGLSGGEWGKDKHIEELLKLKERMEAADYPHNGDIQRIIDFINQNLIVLGEDRD